MQIICTSFLTDNHARTSPLSFYRPGALPDAQPTASKHWMQLPHHHYMENVWTLLQQCRLWDLTEQTERGLCQNWSVKTVLMRKWKEESNICLCYPYLKPLALPVRDKWNNLVWIRYGWSVTDSQSDLAITTTAGNHPCCWRHVKNDRRKHKHKTVLLLLL